MAKITFTSIKTINDAIKYVKQFLNDYSLDIDGLKDFPFKNLESDSEYGCPDRSFDYDDTNLARAIYFIIWKDLPEMDISEIGTGKKYRGDTLNTFNTMFSADLSRCDILSGGNKELCDKAEVFRDICYSLGNFSVLPNISIPLSKNKETTINLYRGNWNGWKDFYDTFLRELNLCLPESNNANEVLAELVKANSFYFLQIDSISKFKDINFLSPYFTEGDTIKELFKHDFYGWKLDSKAYIGFANFYIDKATEIIKYRADVIIQKLNEYFNKV